jgi:hypothetical protein
MEHTLEHRIRERAYEIWRLDGRAEGKAVEHWLAAERELLSSSDSEPTPPKLNGQRKQSRKRAAAILANGH